MQLKNKLNSNEFIILAEMQPPKGVDASRMVTIATQVKDKVDAFLVPDLSNAVMSMSALGTSMILKAKGIETVMQITCRDRNRLALQAELLSAFACGINTIMVAEGENPRSGDHYEAKVVNDIDLLELIEATQRLQEGKDMAGNDLDGSPEFLVCSTINPGVNGNDLDIELERINNKIDKGAQFFITPPLFDLDTIDPFLKQASQMKKKIIPTVLLLKSAGMARYIDRHYDFIHIPDTIINRIQKASNTLQESVQCAEEMVSKIKDDGFCGVLLSTIGWEDKLPVLLERIVV